MREAGRFPLQHCCCEMVRPPGAGPVFQADVVAGRSEHGCALCKHPGLGRAFQLALSRPFRRRRQSISTFCFLLFAVVQVIVLYFDKS